MVTQHLKNFTYADVMAMPTSERRFYIGLSVKKNHEQQEAEELKPKVTSTGGRTRTTTVTGRALDNKMKNGDITL